MKRVCHLCGGKKKKIVSIPEDRLAPGKHVKVGRGIPRPRREGASAKSCDETRDSLGWFSHIFPPYRYLFHPDTGPNEKFPLREDH